MDKSKERIEKLKKLTAVQALRNDYKNMIEPGDWFETLKNYSQTDKFIGSVIKNMSSSCEVYWLMELEDDYDEQPERFYLNHPYTWLPRIDQHLEILKEQGYCFDLSYSHCVDGNLIDLNKPETALREFKPEETSWHYTVRIYKTTSGGTIIQDTIKEGIEAPTLEMCLDEVCEVALSQIL